jgi:polyferredoxin
MEIFTELPTAENCIKFLRNKFKKRESQRDDLTKDRIKILSKKTLSNIVGAQNIKFCAPTFINYYKEFKLLPNAR